MSKLFYGSIDFSKLVEEAKKKNPSFKIAENRKCYLSVQIWLNDEADKYGNVMSIKNAGKDLTDEQKFYLANLKESEKKEPKDIDDKMIEELDDIPF